MVIDPFGYEDTEDHLEDLEDESGDVRCPNCGGKWIRVEGRCVTCETCGWSKCEINE